MSALEKPFITPEQYLELERKAETKSEYYAGQIFAMAGASEAHILVVSNLIIEIGTQLRRRPCRVYGTDMKVKVSASGLFTYPDVSVVCGEVRYADKTRDMIENPSVIVEVLSPSTQGYDRGEKFAQYQRLASLTDYLLVSQDVMRVEHFVWQGDDRWLLSTYQDPSAVIDLASIGCGLLLSDVYQKVDISPERDALTLRRL